MMREELFDFAVLVHKHGMVCNTYGCSVATPAFKDTEFEAATNLYAVSNLTVFSPEVNVGALMKAVKKTPQLILLGEPLLTIIFKPVFIRGNFGPTCVNPTATLNLFSDG